MRVLHEGTTEFVMYRSVPGLPLSGTLPVHSDLVGLREGLGIRYLVSTKVVVLEIFHHLCMVMFRRPREENYRQVLLLCRGYGLVVLAYVCRVRI